MPKPDKAIHDSLEAAQKVVWHLDGSLLRNFTQDVKFLHRIGSIIKIYTSWNSAIVTSVHC
jgi:hypothetical protein